MSEPAPRVRNGPDLRTTQRVVGLAVLLAIAGFTALVVAALNQQPAPPQPVTEAATTPSPTPTSPSTPNTPGTPTSPATSASPGTPRSGGGRGLELKRSEPVRIGIPKLGVSASIEHLELDDDGAMQVPKDPAKAGWFSPSVTPGVVGSSIIAGHVTWNQAPAVFFKLGDLDRGNTIEIARRDGGTAVFTVERVGRFSKDAFPTDQVYDGAKYPALRLITCGGEYDTVHHRYLDNIVVWARLTATR